MIALRDNSSLSVLNHIPVDMFMSTDTSGSRTPVDAVRTDNLSLSKWVNEPLPPWSEIVNAHEVARLTRRHRWILSASTLLGRFLRRQHFRGRRIGWLRSDVAVRLVRKQGASNRHSQRPQHPCSTVRLRKCLPLRCTALRVRAHAATPARLRGSLRPRRYKRLNNLSKGVGADE
jgi:hypothetical protein